jgi:hypothetical protein
MPFTIGECNDYENLPLKAFTILLGAPPVGPRPRVCRQFCKVNRLWLGLASGYT